MAAETVAVGGASRPLPGESVNGDAWTVDRHGRTCRITVIDGLGHGPDAASAAGVAVAILRDRPELAPIAALEACQDALVGTRGAAISVATIDLDRAQLTYAGVGNVEARLWLSGRARRLIAYRGIVGGPSWRVHAFEHMLTAGWRLLIHTDGVRSRLPDSLVADHAGKDLTALAGLVLADWARETDDATVVVAGEESWGGRGS
jgi:serine phosphatase RsbU (regulator of sigma subunit)